MVYKDTKTYQELAESQLESILSLSEADISKYIENSMTKPVMVSKTMANDQFLADWLSKEPEKINDRAYMNKLYSYLKAYQAKYAYTTVFCVSERTGRYYYQDGLNKTISREDSHDIWYYNFIDSGHEFDIQVDTNEADGNKITVFVNFRMEDKSGRLLGVIGVGLLVDSIEEAIRTYERDYGLSVYIVNAGGAQNSFNGSTDIFVDMNELAERTGISDKIDTGDVSEPKMQWFTSGGERKCIIAEYDETLKWYLFLEKDTDSINSAFQARVKDSVLYMLISLVICITVTTVVFSSYNRRIIIMENTDDLTGLLNRKLFNKQYQVFVRKNREHKKSMFIIDIDHFKDINDAYGHMFGNAILAMVGESLGKAIKDRGIAARWGGDEFVGIMAADSEETERLIRRFTESLEYEEKGERCRVSVSIGIAEFSGKPAMEQIVKKADTALYRSKQLGRNRITVAGRDGENTTDNDLSDVRT
jgi:diguanylate cyclase (GGDEF)-like protein